MNYLIVVNADDFGMSSGVNGAILRSFELGYISTTTIMCNMPGFEEACQIAHDKKLTDRIGIHFNLTEGYPLSEKIKRLSKFCDQDGRMFKSFKGHLFSASEREAVYEELEMQLKKLKSFGITPTHADSHHHSHHFIGTQSIVIKLATANQIPAVRLRFNFGRLSPQRKLYSKLFNMRLELAGLAKTKYFCEIRSVNKSLFEKNKPVEVMVHPYPGEDGGIVNYNAGKPLPPIIEKYLPKTEFVTYDFLNKNV
ncbi:MAG TPA: ChbG/HpnK family deacetylase [Ignavibacteriaceae bacterium]|nr:ChbG/HpnK family deacetylase [Ignavibacteriaceae bacterium]